jgi:hypothetical protein
MWVHLAFCDHGLFRSPTSNSGTIFLLLLYMVRGSVTCFLTLTEVFAFSRSRSPTLLLSRLCLASLSCSFACGGSFVNFPSSMMAHVKSTACFVAAITSSANEGHESEGSAERIESARLSDVGSHGEAVNDTDEGSRTWSYYFGPSTVAVSRIRGIVDGDYFVEGMGHELKEETASAEC